MWPRVQAVRVLDRQCVALDFTDGSSGTLDLAPMLAGRGGVFLALRDPAVFAAVRADPVAGTLVWPNGADIDPDVIYTTVHGGTRAAAVREGTD